MAILFGDRGQNVMLKSVEEEIERLKNRCCVLERVAWVSWVSVPLSGNSDAAIGTHQLIR